MVKLLVEATALCKRFGTRWALQRVDLTVAAGELVALVGANGSGKSTLLKLLAGLLRPDGGRLTVAGHEPWREREAVMRTTRFAFAPPALFEALTGREQLVALASAGGASVAARGREVERALAALGLAARADDRVRTYSFGLRQRLTLAQALLPLPQLLVLDEPTEGLDPVAVRELRGLLRRLRDESGIAIVLASHLAAEVELLADRLVVLEEGRVAFAGPVEELLAGQEEWVLAVDRPQAAAAALVAAGFTPRPARERDRADELRVAPRTGTGGASGLPLARLQELLGGAGVVLRECHRDRPRLEEALLARAVATPGAPEPER